MIISAKNFLFKNKNLNKIRKLLILNLKNFIKIINII